MGEGQHGENEYFHAKIGFDTAEKGSPEGSKHRRLWKALRR